MARATRTICAAGMAVSFSAQAGVLSLSSRFHHFTRPKVSFSSNAASSTVLPATNRFLPSLKSPTNSRFHRPSVRITCAMAPASAPSVPGCSGSHSCALAATLESRGSTAITVPRFTISPKRWMTLGTMRLEASGSHAPRDQAVGLVEVVVAVAEEALREAGAHLLGFGADGAVREVVGGAEDLGERAVEQVRGGRRVAAAHVDELVGLADFRSSIILSATVSSASSQVMGTNFGSMPRPLAGLVRFIGTLMRSGS